VVTIEIFCEEKWLMLCAIGIDHDQKETSVEELCHKDTIRDRGEPLTVCVLTNPSDELDGNHFEDLIEENNDYGNCQ